MKNNSRKVGRPLEEIDKTQFERLCGIHCTKEEIADFFGICGDTVQNWCLREYGENFSALYKKFSAKGNISIRRSQFKCAENGNASMLIWLGKQYLGQKEQGEFEIKDNGLMGEMLDCLKRNSIKND